MDPKQFISGLDIPMRHREMCLASEGCLWKMVQRGNAGIEQMKKHLSSEGVTIIWI